METLNAFLVIFAGMFILCVVNLVVLYLVVSKLAGGAASTSPAPTKKLFRITRPEDKSSVSAPTISTPVEPAAGKDGVTFEDHTVERNEGGDELVSIDRAPREGLSEAVDKFLGRARVAAAVDKIEEGEE